MGNNVAKCGKCGQALRERADNRGRWCPCVTDRAVMRALEARSCET